MKATPWQYRLALSTFLAALILISGCTVNPVTGERQLALLPESQALAMGQEQYIPTQQTQGGKFYLDPELNLYVKEVGQKLAAVSDRPDLPYEFVVLNNGVPNAWALPGGKIAINRGLLTELESEAQLAAVLSHEIVHAAAGHSQQQMQNQALISLGVGLAGFALSDNEWAGVIMGGATMGAQLIMARYSQGDELESDAYGMRYMARAGYDPSAAVELQEIFVRLSEGRESGFLQGLFASHPPSRKRVEENRQLAKELGTSGRTGQDTYQQKLSYLRKLQPAYEAEAEAGRLASEGSFDQALSKINEAIAIEDEEAAFYALRGQIREAMGNTRQAAEDLDRATSLYPEMFSYQLYQGLNALKQNNLTLAKRSLTRANEVVPTSIAFLRLGDVALKQGNREEAARHYATAAKSEGAIAEEARQKLADLTS